MFTKQVDILLCKFILTSLKPKTLNKRKKKLHFAIRNNLLCDILMRYLSIEIEFECIQKCKCTFSNSKVTANLYCICVSVLGRLRDLQYKFVVTLS